MCRWWYRTTLQLSEQMCNALSTWSCCWGQLFEYVGFCRNDSGTCKTSSKYVESTTLSVSDVPALFLEMLLFLVSSSLGGNISTVFGKAWRRLAQSWTVKFEPKGCRALTAVCIPLYPSPGPGIMTVMRSSTLSLSPMVCGYVWMCLMFLARLSAYDSLD